MKSWRLTAPWPRGPHQERHCPFKDVFWGPSLEHVHTVTQNPLMRIVTTVTNRCALTRMTNRLTPTGNECKTLWRNSHQGNLPGLSQQSHAPTNKIRFCLQWHLCYVLCGATFQQNHLLLKAERILSDLGDSKMDRRANSKHTCYWAWYMKSESQMNEDDEAQKRIRNTLCLVNNPQKMCQYWRDLTRYHEVE